MKTGRESFSNDSRFKYYRNIDNFYAYNNKGIVKLTGQNFRRKELSAAELRLRRYCRTPSKID